MLLDPRTLPSEDCPVHTYWIELTPICHLEQSKDRPHQRYLLLHNSHLTVSVSVARNRAVQYIFASAVTSNEPALVLQPMPSVMKFQV